MEINLRSPRRDDRGAYFVFTADGESGRIYEDVCVDGEPGQEELCSVCGKYVALEVWFCLDGKVRCGLCHKTTVS